MSKKAFRAQTKSVFKVPRQGVIHIQDLKEIYFVTNLGYEDLRLVRFVEDDMRARSYN